MEMEDLGVGVCHSIDIYHEYAPAFKDAGLVILLEEPRQQSTEVSHCSKSVEFMIGKTNVAVISEIASALKDAAKGSHVSIFNIARP